MNTKRTSSRIKKIRALAERGFAGEKSAAAAILRSLLPGYRCVYGPCQECTLRGCHDRVAEPTLSAFMAAEKKEVIHELTTVQRHLPAND